MKFMHKLASEMLIQIREFNQFQFYHESISAKIIMIAEIQTSNSFSL